MHSRVPLDTETGETATVDPPDSGGTLDATVPRSGLTGHTGGTASDLDGVATAGLAGAVPMQFVLFTDDDGTRGAFWYLVPRGSLDASSDVAAGRVLPVDYDESTNDYLWLRVS